MCSISLGLCIYEFKDYLLLDYFRKRGPVTVPSKTNCRLLNLEIGFYLCLS
nr:MAG TPA: flt3 ligand [Caudoviricetes sp.]